MPDPAIERLHQEAVRLSGQAKRAREDAQYRDADGMRALREADQISHRAAAKFAEAAKLEKRRKQEIKLIHVGCRDRGLDEETRRALYRRVTDPETGGTQGVSSVADMTAAQRRAVIDDLKRLGFRPRPAQHRKAGRQPRNISYAPRDYRAKIEAQLSDMSLSWAYTESILRRMRALPDDIACPITGASAKELRALLTALHVEQEKRQLLAAVDGWLAENGRDRAWCAGRFPGAGKDWARNRATLRHIHRCLLGYDFRLRRQ